MPRYTAYRNWSQEASMQYRRCSDAVKSQIMAEITRRCRRRRMTKAEFVRRAMEDLGILEADDE